MSVLRKYGAGLALVGRTLLLELFSKRLKTGAAAPTDGQVLRYVASDDAWSPGTVSGGGSLPSGALGSILVHDGAAWAARVIGANGRVLRVASGEPQWAALTAADVGAIAEPTLVYGSLHYNAAVGEWRLATPSSTRQVLRSDVDGEGLEFASDVAPLTQRAIDNAASGVSVCATIAHTLSSGVAGAGIGARVTLAAHNAAGTLTDAAALDGILTNTGAGTEAGAFAISTRTAGGALTERLRVHGAGGLTIGVTAAPTNANDVGYAAGAALLWRNAGNTMWFTALSVTSAGTVVLGDSVGSGGAVQVIPGSTTYFAIYSTNQPRWTHFGHLTQSSGTGTHVAQAPVIQQSGTAGWTLLGLAPALVSEGSGTKRAISYSVSGTERFGLDQNGCFVGLRLRRTAVTDAAHTVAALSCYVDMVGLTAARTVTGPSTPVQAGTVVVLTNGDGSASGTNTVTFAPASGTVNGAATHVAINAAYGSCTYVCDGTNWTVIAKV